MKKLLLVPLIFIFGCEKDAIETTQTDNRAFSVERLFTVDSCNVYRFKDNGNTHYICICPNQQSTISGRSVNRGKYHTMEYEEIQTAKK
jgi:hypothetical protein